MQMLVVVTVANDNAFLTNTILLTKINLIFVLNIVAKQP